MKKTAQVSVLTGLLLAPSLLVNSSEVAAQQTPSAVSYNTVAELDISMNRLVEIQKLNEKSIVANFKAYKEIVDKLETANFISEDAEKLLTAKLDYLEELEKLRKRTIDFKNGVSVLNVSNATLFTAVHKLQTELSNIETAVEESYGKLDAAIKEAEKITTDVPILNATTTMRAFITASFSSMTDYTTALASFKTAYQLDASVTKVNQLADDLVGADKFLKDYISGTSSDILEDYDDVEDGGQEDFRALMTALNIAFKESLTSTQQQIVNAQTPVDTRTVAQMIKAANDDIAVADKLNVAVDAFAAKTFTTGAILKKELETHQATYNKMNIRQKVMADKYQPDADGKIKDYDDVLDVMLQIDALKPTATEAYHAAVKAADIAYQGLITQPVKQAIVKNGNYKKLTDALATINKAQPVITKIEKIKDNKTAAEVATTRKAYDALDAATKTVVYNYPDLQAWEKAQKSTLAIETAINKLTITNSKTFGTSVASAYKKYAVIDEEKQALVTNGYRMEYLKPFGDAVTAFYGLKVTAKDYKEQVDDLQALIGTVMTAADGKVTLAPSQAMQDLVDAAKTNASTTEKYTTDEAKLEILLNKLITDTAAKKQQIVDAENVEQLIEKANGSFANLADKYTAILAAREAYTKLGESNKDALKLVSNLKTLTALEKIIKKPADVMKKMVAVDVEAATFASKAKTAMTAYNKLTATEKKYLPQDYQSLATDFETFLKFVNQMKAIKPSSSDFKNVVQDARTQLTKLKTDSAWKSAEPKKQALKDQAAKYEGTVFAYETYVNESEALIARIDKLGTLPVGQFLNEITAIAAIYSKLPADVKKQVTNYKQFQEIQKDGKAALKVVDLINQDIIKTANVTNSDYVKRFSTALKAYEKLTSTQKGYVYNYQTGLKPYLKVYELVEAVGKLKPTSKTYLAEVNNIREMYNRLSLVEQGYVKNLLPSITDAEAGIEEVKRVIKLIDEVKPGVENYVQRLIEAREAYDGLAMLNPAYQKLVTNYKTLTNREKQLQPVTTAIYQIKELEEILARSKFDATDFVKKYGVAIKSFEKIDYEARELVYNRETLFTAIYPLAKTIEAIDKIKPASKTFSAEVKEARAWYNSLSDADKARVANYDKLVSFEKVVSTGDTVDQQIMDIATKAPSQYMQAIKDARAAYEALTADQKKAVTRYKELQNYEKGVKNVQAAIDAIDGLQFASNLVSAYDKASKAMDKLTAEQRQMISNVSKLQSVAPAIEVYKMIAALKPGNANYTGTVQAAYAAYNMLSNAEKQYVTNFADLQDAKNNVDTVQQVIAKITSISPSSRDYAKQVEEALALYNSLPSAVKKLVTNYDVLKGSQTEVTAVDKVKQSITEIDPNASTFAAKVKAARTAYDKLSTTQKKLVGNYFLLEEYEAELNDSSSFFF